jgi:hypothetical protein
MLTPILSKIKGQNLFISFMFCVTLINCYSQPKEINIIDKFIKEVILNDNFNVTEVYKYVNVSKDSLVKGTKIYNILEINILLLREQLKNEQYKIINYKKFKSLDDYKSIEIDYKHPENLFFVTIGDIIVTNFVLNKDYIIISFFNGNGIPILIKSKNYGSFNLKKTTPYIFEND